MKLWSKTVAAALFLLAGAVPAGAQTEGVWLPITNITVAVPGGPTALLWADYSASNGLGGLRVYASASLAPSNTPAWTALDGTQTGVMPVSGEPTGTVLPLVTPGATVLASGTPLRFFRLHGVVTAQPAGWGGAGGYLKINLATWETNHYASAPSDLTTDIANATTNLWLRWINPGTFTMGTNANDEVNGTISYPQGATSHKVRLTKGYWVGVFEVTQKQYELVARSLPNTIPATYKADWKPMCYAKYDDIRGGSSSVATTQVTAGSFMGKLAAKVPGLSFDLPTEAQWEYACRAGTDKALNTGANLASETTDASMDLAGRYSGNKSDGRGGAYGSENLARPGCYLPNAAGLYDMHGNVYEWCLDTWSSPINPALSQDDPVYAADGALRVIRGGYWLNNAQFCRSAYRNNSAPSSSNLYGFRLAAVAD